MSAISNTMSNPRTYRELQKYLRDERSVGRLGKKFKLNSKKTVLQGQVRFQQQREKNESDKIEKKLANTSREHGVIDIELTKFVSLKTVVKNIKIIPGYLAVLEYGGLNYTITENTKRKLLQSFGSNDSDIFLNQVDIPDAQGSDNELVMNLTGLDSIGKNVTVFYKSTQARRQQGGSYFKWSCNMDVDLSRYQIYPSSGIPVTLMKDASDNCFIHALHMSGILTDSELTKAKGIIINDFTPQSCLRKVAELLKIGLEIVRQDSKRKEQSRVVKINPKADPERIIKMGLLEEHYFIFDKACCVTSYAIKNWETIRELPRWNLITNKNNKRDSKKHISSYLMIKTLLEYKDTVLKDCDNLKTFFPPEVSVPYIHDLGNDESNDISFTPIEFKDKSVDKNGESTEFESIVFFDYETTTNGNSHIPYMLCSATQSKYGTTTKTYTGEYMTQNFLNSLEDNTLCVAHNLGYDIRFIYPFLGVDCNIQKSMSNIPFVTGYFMNYRQNKMMKLTFKCSYAMTDMPLRNFPKVFGLPSIKKEIMPYGLYTNESVKSDTVSIQKALDWLPASEHAEFMENVVDMKMIKDDQFYHMDYAEFYCKRDCEITMKGYDIFKGWMDTATGLNIDNYVTIASLAYANLEKEGCFEGCYNLAGVPQQFIQKTIAGGRTMVSENKKHATNDVLADLDGVSLYPSAMARMEGFLKGKPKVITGDKLNYSFLKAQDGFFVEVNVLSAGIKRKFPLLNQVDSGGVRQYSNDVTGTIFIDKYGLEDLVEFQDINFEIIKGYYFNEGFNERIKTVITDLFEARLAMKKIKNPIQSTYKLLMNSCYGKTCLKPIVSEYKILSKERFDKHLIENYNFIQYWTELPSSGKGSSKVAFKELKHVIDHKNACHIGSTILSMSKRIMNEVMCLAEDNKMNINYQDTDSMHIEDCNVLPLSDLYTQKYGRELLGKNLGQFHVDFEDSSSSYPNLNGIKSFTSDTEPMAVKSIFLGKKSYIDKVRLTKDDNVHYGYHIRMKGIPNACIMEKCKQEFNNDPMALYQHLYEGNEVTFNLLDNGTKSGAVMFKANKDYSIGNVQEFHRCVSFK